MEPSAISDQVDRILRSRTLANKSQLKKLLETLHKNIDSQTTLKTDDVIRELWPDETRTKRSADVATEMNRLRNALEIYYRKEGSDDPIVIYLPSRSAPAQNGRQEKTWIAAKYRGAAEEHQGSPATVTAENPRKGLKIVTAIAGLCLGGVVAYICIRAVTMDRRPQFARLDGSMLVIMNAEGKELWRKAFPDGFGPDWYYAHGLAERLWFGDLDGKGHTSVLFSYSSAANQQPRSSTLICYSDRGEEKWRWTPGRALPQFEGSPATFMTVALAILKNADKRPDQIIVSSQHVPWWEDQIAVLDSNGRTVSEYWHSGALSSMVLADLDGDGREEIIATGINNDFLQATLVVLEPDRVFGASAEVRPKFQIHGMVAAQERLRLLFPRSDLNKALFSFNGAMEPTIVNGSIRLTVQECIVPPGCPVWYEFDKNLNLISAYAGDEFRGTHAQFYRSRKDDHPFTAAEQAEFQKVRCLVGCKSEFVPVDIR